MIFSGATLLGAVRLFNAFSSFMICLFCLYYFTFRFKFQSIQQIVFSECKGSKYFV
ncbi:Uncharacterised protein [Segatella copri]|nr:Uncharacterised protein [Segatella copri]